MSANPSRPNSKPTTATSKPITQPTPTQPVICPICYDPFNIYNHNHNNSSDIVDRTPVQYLPCQHVICIQCFTIYNNLYKNTNNSTCVLCNQVTTKYNILKQLPHTVQSYDTVKENLVENNAQYYTVEYNVNKVRYTVIYDKLLEYQSKYNTNTQTLQSQQYTVNQLQQQQTALQQQIQQLQLTLSGINNDITERTHVIQQCQCDDTVYKDSIEQLQQALKPIELQCNKSELMLRGLQYLT